MRISFYNTKYFSFANVLLNTLPVVLNVFLVMPTLYLCYFKILTCTTYSIAINSFENKSSYCVSLLTSSNSVICCLDDFVSVHVIKSNWCHA